MKTSNDLKQERASLIQKQQELTDNATNEKRDLTEVETTEFRTRQQKINDYKQLIADAEAREENDALMAESRGENITGPKGPAIVKSTKNEFDHGRRGAIAGGASRSRLNNIGTASENCRLSMARWQTNHNWARLCRLGGRMPSTDAVYTPASFARLKRKR